MGRKVTCACGRMGVKRAGGTCSMQGLKDTKAPLGARHASALAVAFQGAGRSRNTPAPRGHPAAIMCCHSGHQKHHGAGRDVASANFFLSK